MWEGQSCQESEVYFLIRFSGLEGKMAEEGVDTLTLAQDDEERCLYGNAEPASVESHRALGVIDGLTQAKRWLEWPPSRSTQRLWSRHGYLIACLRLLRQCIQNFGFTSWHSAQSRVGPHSSASDTY